MKNKNSRNSLYGILSALMLLNVALLFPSSANAQYQSKLPKCEGLNSNRWDMCYGEETSRNGVNYKGEYKDGYRHGFGIITYGNKEKYVGQFVQGRNEGRGALFAADGRKLKEGAWEKDEFVEVSSAELEERRRKAEIEKLQSDIAAAKKAQLDAERGKTDAENARRAAEANAKAVTENAKKQVEATSNASTVRADSSKNNVPQNIPKQAPVYEARSDMATSICSSYLRIVERSVDLRQQGVPINIAHKMADSALNLNPQLYRFIIGAINTAYQNPQFILDTLSDGRLLNMCAKEVRGF